MSWASVSQRIAAGVPEGLLIGWLLTCYNCRRSFRSFRLTETHCGCCAHLKDQVQ